MNYLEYLDLENDAIFTAKQEDFVLENYKDERGLKDGN